MTTTLHVPHDPHAALQAAAGPGGVRAAGPEDAVGGAWPRWVVEPGSAAELARALAAANSAGLRVIPRGGGTKLDWGNLPRGADVILSTRRLDHVLEHAAGDMTATVEAGCTIVALQQTLAEKGQRLALDPLWPNRATVGGVLATNDSGPLRHAFGSLRDLLIGVTVALPDGTLARSGGKVVKNVAGYDLPKLFTGSFGTLGVIVQATFRLHPLPADARTLHFAVPPGSLGRFIPAMAECGPLTAGVQVRVADDAPPVADVRVEGLSGAIVAKISRVVEAACGAGAEPVEASHDAWAARERLFQDAETSVVCKVCTLPTRWPAVIDLASTSNCHWRLVAQGVGVGLLRIERATSDELTRTVQQLRGASAPGGGSLIVLHGPADVKKRIDVWGDAGSALPLMRRVKQQFDPAGALNPGRFVGGI